MRKSQRRTADEPLKTVLKQRIPDDVCLVPVLTSSSNERIQQINADLDETQRIMQKNVDDMMVNTAKAEELNQQAEMMNQNADQFRKKSEDIRCQMWWKNVKVCSLRRRFVPGISPFPGGGHKC